MPAAEATGLTAASSSTRSAARSSGSVTPQPWTMGAACRVSCVSTAHTPRHARRAAHRADRILEVVDEAEEEDDVVAAPLELGAQTGGESPCAVGAGKAREPGLRMRSRPPTGGAAHRFTAFRRSRR